MIRFVAFQPKDSNNVTQFSKSGRWSLLETLERLLKYGPTHFFKWYKSSRFFVGPLVSIFSLQPSLPFYIEEGATLTLAISSE